MNNSIERHSNEWEENSQAWENKPELRDAYADIYQNIKQKLKGDSVLEIGSGMAKSKLWIPTITTSDREPNPWIDRVESAYKVNSPDASWDHIIMVDVLHHLEKPRAFFKEIHRVLKPKGTLIIVEPDISLLGWLIYGLCHKEPIGYFQNISTDSTQPTIENYYARQSSAFRIFIKNQYPEIIGKLKIMEIIRLPMLYYVLTGGFSGPNIASKLNPTCTKWIKSLEKKLYSFPKVASTRILAVLERP